MAEPYAAVGGSAVVLLFHTLGIYIFTTAAALQQARLLHARTTASINGRRALPESLQPQRQQPQLQALGTG